MDNFLIYGLIDPRSGELRYVGKSASGMRRPKAHSKPSTLKSETNHCRNWVKGLVSLDLKPDIEVLETCASAEALAEAEQHHIAYFRMVGCRLTNLTDGGEGMVGNTPSNETRAKLSAANKGKKLSPSHRAKLSQAHMGVVHSAETRAKLSSALSGRKQTIEHRTKNSRARGGRPFQDQNGTVYYSQAQAAEALGLWQGNISKVLLGRFESTGGYRFWFTGPMRRAARRR